MAGRVFEERAALALTFTRLMSCLKNYVVYGLPTPVCFSGVSYSPSFLNTFRRYVSFIPYHFSYLCLLLDTPFYCYSVLGHRLPLRCTDILCFQLLPFLSDVLHLSCWC
jgi:hypothetical protein